MNFFKENIDGNIIDARWFYRSKNDRHLEIRLISHLKLCKTVPDFHHWINHFNESVSIEQLSKFKERVQKIEYGYLVNKSIKESELLIKNGICRVYMKWNQEMME